MFKPIDNSVEAEDVPWIHLGHLGNGFAATASHRVALILETLREGQKTLPRRRYPGFEFSLPFGLNLEQRFKSASNAPIDS
jgi:hypothetical protein